MRIRRNFLVREAKCMEYGQNFVVTRQGSDEASHKASHNRCIASEE